MNFKKDYPRFGFPSAVNRTLYSVALASEQEIATINLDSDNAIIDINIMKAVDELQVNLNDYQVFPFNLNVNNTADSDAKVILAIALNDGTIATLELAAPATKQTLFAVAPDKASDTLNAIQMNQSAAVEAPITVSDIEKNVGMTYEGATTGVKGNVITFSGKIPYYAADMAIGRTEGNRVGVQVKAPAGVNVYKSNFIIDGKKYTGAALDLIGEDEYVLNWWPLMSVAGQKKTIQLNWVVGGTIISQDYEVAIAEDATFADESEALPK